jgi:hypothetical protein
MRTFTERPVSGLVTLTVEPIGRGARCQGHRQTKADGCMRGASADSPGAEHHRSILRVIRTNLCAALLAGHDVTQGRSHFERRDALVAMRVSWLIE